MLNNRVPIFQSHNTQGNKNPINMSFNFQNTHISLRPRYRFFDNIPWLAVNTSRNLKGMLKTYFGIWRDLVTLCQVQTEKIVNVILVNLLTSPFVFYETLPKLRLMYFWSRMYKEWEGGGHFKNQMQPHIVHKFNYQPQKARGIFIYGLSVPFCSYFIKKELPFWGRFQVYFRLNLLLFMPHLELIRPF